MDIRRSGSHPSRKGPEDWFTGVVRVDAPFSGSGALSAGTVTFEPGEKHWRGASADCAMTHLAIAEMKDGAAVTWLEKVTDAEYGGWSRVTATEAALERPSLDPRS